MKKIYFIIAIMGCFCFSNVNSQTNQGRYLLGFSSNLGIFNLGSNLFSSNYSSVNGNPSYKIFTLNFTPRFG
jgi:hypothetical protein